MNEVLKGQLCRIYRTRIAHGRWARTRGLRSEQCGNAFVTSRPDDLGRKPTLRKVFEVQGYNQIRSTLVGAQATDHRSNRGEINC
jgi:hypothetical protein